MRTVMISIQGGRLHESGGVRLPRSQCAYAYVCVYV